jgi:hypothetical protein
MAKYTDSSETIDAIQWSGSFSAIQTFLVEVSPFFIDPKVTEDNPDATGVAALPDGRLSVFVGGSTVFEYAQSGDWLARGANTHLRTIDATSFAANWTLVP